MPPSAAPSRAEIRAIAEATYDHVWSPAHDVVKYSGSAVPWWGDDAHGFVDPDTGDPLPTFDDAADALTEPAHVVTLGPQVHVEGTLGGTEEAGRHVG